MAVGWSRQWPLTADTDKSTSLWHCTMGWVSPCSTGGEGAKGWRGDVDAETFDEDRFTGGGNNRRCTICNRRLTKRVYGFPKNRLV